MGKEQGTTEGFIIKARLKHGDRYDYYLVEYTISQAPVTIVCKHHGPFIQKANNHLNGANCLQCGIESRTSKRKKTREQFIKEATELHDGKYDYSEVEYVNTLTKVRIMCPDHGAWLQLPLHHLKGHGCDKCFREKITGSIRMSKEDFIERATKLHGSLYDYSRVKITGRNNKVEIICKRHNVFRQDPYNHLSGYGCLKCASSRGELKIESTLSEWGVKFEVEKRFPECKSINILPFDFYVPSKNLLIEYDGEQHFRAIGFFGGEKGLKATQRRDNIKNGFAKKYGYNLLRIKYTEFDRIEEILNEALNLNQSVA